ncbi:MAG TPA: carboxymuconolactone decarboxylase family protein [Tepidisphaeraceae bacterium]|jgi:uncharacterized peroxidase-related enzyme
MSRIKIPAREDALAESQPLLDTVEKRLGFVPNLHCLLSISPPVLTGLLHLQDTLSKTLDARTRNAIALAVSEVNACSYCLSAHCYVASHINHTALEEIALNRRGESGNAKIAAAARFAAKVVDARGHIDDEEFNAVRDAGFTDPQILEIVALAVQFQMTNLINNVTGTEIDLSMIEESPVQRGGDAS